MNCIPNMIPLIIERVRITIATLVRTPSVDCTYRLVITCQALIQLDYHCERTAMLQQFVKDIDVRETNHPPIANNIYTHFVTWTGLTITCHHFRALAIGLIGVCLFATLAAFCGLIGYSFLSGCDPRLGGCVKRTPEVNRVIGLYRLSFI